MSYELVAQCCPWYLLWIQLHPSNNWKEAFSTFKHYRMNMLLVYSMLVSGFTIQALVFVLLRNCTAIAYYLDVRVYRWETASWRRSRCVYISDLDSYFHLSFFHFLSHLSLFVGESGMLSSNHRLLVLWRNHKARRWWSTALVLNAGPDSGPI